MERESRMGVPGDNWEKIRSESRKHWRKLTDEDLAQVKESAADLVDVVKNRYNYSPERAQQDVEEFLQRYNTKVFDFAQRHLPSEMVNSIVRNPWAALVTALGLGLILGFLFKPGSGSDRE